VSQLLTLYTTPVVYMYLDQLRLLGRRRKQRDLRDTSPATAAR
jgi:multidrug efflux pump